jgi:hypothetical protein
VVGLVVAESIARQVLEDVPQRLLADLTDRARRELELIAVAFDEPSFLEQLGDLVELVELILGLFAQLAGQHLAIDRRWIGRIDGLAHLPFEAVHLLQVAHDLRGLLEVERLLAAERVASA